MTPFHEVLAPLLTGFTVTKVEAGQGREGDPAKVTCRKGDTVRTFEVWGGIYGPCVSHVKESRAGTPEVWTDVGEMFSNITDHVCYKAPDTVIEAVDDPRTLRLGFRCRDTGAEWWVKLPTAKGSKFCQRFSTIEGRESLAQCLTDGGHGLYAFDTK
jgi:hypothetical protein